MNSRKSLEAIIRGEVSDTTENSICAFRILRFGTRVFQILIGHISVLILTISFNDPRFSKTKFNEREHALRERVAYIDAHKKEEIAALREEVYGEPNPYRKVTCPTCGSTNTKKISGLSKAASVGLFGIFSQKVKHQFHCNSCGYEW